MIANRKSASGDLTLTFVMHPGQNWFFYELVNYIRFELNRLGITSEISQSGFPQLERDRVYVLVSPHEYFRLNGNKPPYQEFFERSIFLCAEQPETEHFDRNLELAPSAGAVFDINARSARLARRAGIEARHFQLGYSDAWLAQSDKDIEPERNVDLAFLGCSSSRRSRFLASYDDVAHHRHCQFVISDNSLPNLKDSPRFVGEKEKGELLRRSKILLNIHQGEEHYFEWVRYLDAVHCGCVVVSETASDYFPLTVGEHLLMGRAGDLAEMADLLLDDEASCSKIASDALQFVKTHLPLSKSVGELVDVASEVASREISSKKRWGTSWDEHRDPNPLVALPQPDLYSGPEFTDPTRSALKDVKLELMDLRRTLALINYRLETGEEPGGHEVVKKSKSYESAEPRVSVITPLFNHGSHVAKALDSVRRNDFESLEVIVVDDGSTDGGGEVVKGWIADNPEIPATLIRVPINAGLPRARNLGLSLARGEYCFMLDSDNVIHSDCLRKLVGVLDHDDSVEFAYGIVAAFTPDGEASHLLSQFEWDLDALRRDNFVDAMALVRRSALEAVGGFCTDKRIYGWEDYDLWLSFAERGFKGTIVREVLARYLASPASMLSITSLSAISSRSVLEERHAEFFAG